MPMPLTYWLRRRILVCATHLWAAKGLNSLQKIPDKIFYDWIPMSSIMLWTVGSQETFIKQGAMRILGNLWHVLLETWTELQKLRQLEEKQKSPKTSKGDWKYLTLGLTEVTDSPSYNNGYIDWYVRMPTSPPLNDSKNLNAILAIQGRRCHSRSNIS